MQSIEIQNVVKKHFNLTGIISNLPGDLDLNFKIKTPTDEQFIIKLMRSGCETSLIDIQCAILLHLEKSKTEIQLPKVLRSNADNVFEIVEIEGQQRILWVLHFVPGYLLAEFKPHTKNLMHSFGQSIAHLTNSLEGFEHPAMKNGHRWELTNALEVKDFAPFVTVESKRIIQQTFDRFENKILPHLTALPHSVIHNDANNYNVLVNLDKDGNAKVDGLFDFGDLGFQPTICEVAIALAYAVLEKEFPLRICYHFLKGYSKVRSISEAELSVLFDLIKTRLAVSISISSKRQIDEPDDPYITISQAPAKAALSKIHSIPSELAACFFRKACGFPVLKKTERILSFLKNEKAFPVMKIDHFDCILDLSVGSTLLGADPKAALLENLSQKIDAFMAESNSKFSIGRYCESRRLYAAANFGASGHPTKEKRTNHLGIDIFTEANAPVFAPYDGTIEINTSINLPLDYGGLLILKHHTSKGDTFYTLFGHLNPNSLRLKVGTSFKAGDQIATLGEAHENGGWPPHLHLQIITDLVGLGQEFPGVAFQNEIEIWRSLSPNPMHLFDVPDINIFDATPNKVKLLVERKNRLGYNLSLTYRDPLHIVSGFKQFLFDSHARTYLDFYNNVPHVGHQHPTVVKAIQKQAGLLNTNTRYLHENILNYAKRLTEKLPDHLEVCYFVNSASEANELAIRMARAYTQRKDILVVEAAYHGHTNTLIDISPYKHNGPGGKGAPEWVHTVPIADDYRGEWKKDQPNAGHHYANEVKDILANIESSGRSVAAFIAETYPSVGGQIIPPDGYLKEVYNHVRNHGAICIADEVQTGFGRLGKSFWAFETQGAIPDMVVLGKPIANGFPLGALVTTKAIADAFDNGMEYFSTFGGNPVSCAAGLAVLDVLETENLPENARLRGQEIIDRLNQLKDKFPIIGDVRGEGLFLGIELVRDQLTLEPADREASYIVNRLKDFKILAGTDGPLHNVIKIRPSMGINTDDVGYFIEAMEMILSETFLNKVGESLSE